MVFRVPPVTILLVSPLLCLCGCSQGRSNSFGTFFTIGETFGTICTLNNRLALVVWTDLPGTGSSDGTSTSDDLLFHSQINLKDGRKLAWSCSSRDGKTGRVNIAGVEYDLAKGGLFLVRTKGGGTKVEQLPLEIVGVTESPRAFEFAHAKLRDLAKTDPKIAAFVKGAGEAK